MPFSLTCQPGGPKKIMLSTFFSQIKVRCGMKMAHVGQIVARFQANDILRTLL